MKTDTPFEGLTEPQWADQAGTNLAHTLVSPAQVLTGIFLDLLRQRFGAGTFRRSEALDGLTWVPDFRQTSLIIGVAGEFEPRATDRRPAVLVKRKGSRPTRLSINDQYHGLPAPDPHYSVDSGMPYEVLISSTYTLFCLGRVEAEAEALGVEVWFELMEFGPLIRREGCLTRFELMELPEVGKLEEDTERFVLPVSCTASWQHGWRLRPTGPVLKQTSLQIQPTE